MKTLIIFSLVILFAQLSSATLEIEIQPLSIKPKSYDVLGIKVGSPSRKGLIMTGRSASQISRATRSEFNPVSQMLVITGREIDSLIIDSLDDAAYSHDLVLINTSSFAEHSLKLTLDTIYSGTRFSFLKINRTNTMGKDLVYDLLSAPSDSAYVISDTVIGIIDIPFLVVDRTLDFVCRIPNYFGVRFFGCR